MRIFNKMKKAMLVLMASLFCANVAFADTQTVYSWESPDGTPVETGGTIVHASGDGKRVNYSNAGYYTVCLNGKYGNMNDGDGAKNSDHIVLTLDEALQTGDVISITAYRNKNADGKSSSIYFLFENGAEWKDSNVFTNICADDTDADYDDDGDTPNTVTWTITDAEAGSKTIKMSRNSAGTNLFITKLAITREVEAAEPEGEKVYATFEAPTNTNAVWNAETNSFTWTQSYYNQIRNIGLPNGDITKYEKLVIDCEIISGTQFRILFYKGGDNKQLYITKSGVTEINIAEELSKLGDDYMSYLQECTEICLSGAGDAGEVKINSVYLVAVPETSRFDLTAYNAAVAAAEAFKATLNAEDEVEAMAIEAVDQYVADAAAWLEEVEADAEATQGDVDFIAEDLSAIITNLQGQLETQKLMVKVQEAEAAGQEILAKYPNYTDEAGLVIALRNLPRFAMGMTAEQIQAAIDAVYAAIPLFETENAPLASGDYYLKNVASGKYLVGGNSWGTFATLGDHAEDLGLTMLEDGKYTIDSRLSNGGDNHFLGGAGWMDGAATGWTFAKQAKGIYAITVDGVNYLGWDGANSAAAVNLTDPTNANAQWQVVTKDELVAGLAGATNVAPMDATFFIQDPNFGRNNTRVSAWQGDPVKGGDVTNFCAEKWNTNFDIYQDLAGLPNGYYKLFVQGYYRAGNGGATAMDQNAFLYAGEVSTPLVNINTEAGNAVFEGGNVSDVAGMGIVPNNMETASKAFTAGLYSDNSIVVQVTDGTLRIGVKKETQIEFDWTIFDNFQLLYYGTEEPLALEPGTYYMKNVASGKYLAAANSWGTQASLGNYGLDVDVAYVGDGKYTVDSRVSNGGDRHFLGSNGYVDSPAAEWMFVEQGNGTFALTADGANYIGYDGNSSVVSITLTDAASANAQWQFVTKAELEATLADATMTNPVDATFFIQGQNFGRNDGRNSAWQGGPVIGGDNANMCAEKWNCNFDVYQDLANLPNGYYKVSVQGYYRAGNGGATAMDQNAYLYAGEVSTPLLNINTEAGNSVFNGGNVSDVAGMGIVPNDMATACTAFNAGLYADNSVFAQVTDGTLRIGVKKDIQINADWTIFDNFQLFYYGTENPAPMLAAVDSLNKLIVEVEAWKAELNAEDETEAMVIAQTDQMLAAANAMAAAPASVAEVEGMIASINQYLYMTEVSLAQYKAQAAMMLFTSYDDPSDKAGFENAINQVFIVSNALMMGGEYTMADLDAALATMRVAQKAFIYENPKAPTYSIVAVQGVNRVVALTNELEGLKLYYKTAADAEYMVYTTAPFHISGTTTVWTYAEYTEPVSGDVFTSDVAEYEIAAGTVITLAEPTVEVTGDTEYNCVVTSDQSAIFAEYGVAPKDTIIYEFFPWNEDKNKCDAIPSMSGRLTSGEAINLPAGLLIVKVSAYGYESAVTAKYLGAAEAWEGGEAFVTGIDEVNGKEVKEIKYYTINGVEIEEPVAGVHIRRILFTDGTVKTVKVVGK